MPLHTRTVTLPGVHLSADPAPASAPWEFIPQCLILPVCSFPGCLMLRGFFRLLIGGSVISVVNLPDDIHAVSLLFVSLASLFFIYRTPVLCCKTIILILGPFIPIDCRPLLCSISMACGKALFCHSMTAQCLFGIIQRPERQRNRKKILQKCNALLSVSAFLSPFVTENRAFPCLVSGRKFLKKMAAQRKTPDLPRPA